MSSRQFEQPVPTGHMTASSFFAVFGRTFCGRYGGPVLAGLLAGLILLPGSFAARAEVTGIAGDSFQALVDQGMPVIDIRRPEEWAATGVLENSHLLTFFDKQGRYDVQSWLDELHKIVEKDQPFALICAVGGRTTTVSKFLDGKLEYKNIHNVKGGIRDWIKQGRKVVPPG